MKQEETTSVGGGSETNITRVEIPEHLLPREYGKKEIQTLPLFSLIMLSQQRGANNPAYGEIKASINRGDIINIPDVALVKYPAFVNYIEFVNRIWGSSHNVSDYDADRDGYYHLVIAGHTRTEAMIELETEKAKKRVELGFGDIEVGGPTIDAKIYRDLEPQDILALQMDENLHEKPSPERSAIAIVETYLYGLEIGQWQTRQEFITACKNKFSRTSLNQAIAFCKLDQRTREFVFAGTVPYGSAVEVGKCIDPYKAYLSRKFYGDKPFEELSLDEQQQINHDALIWSAGEIAAIQNHSISARKCRDRYKSFRDGWLPRADDDNGQDALFADIDQDYRDHRTAVRKEFRANVRALTSLPISKAGKALQLHMEILEPDTQEGAEIIDILDSGMKDFEQKVRRLVSSAGETALFAS